MPTKADIIAELLRGGLSNAEAAERVGCSVDYVRAVRSRRRLPGQPRPKMTDEQRHERYLAHRARIRERYQSDPEFRAAIIDQVKRYQRRRKELSR